MGRGLYMGSAAPLIRHMEFVIVPGVSCACAMRASIGFASSVHSRDRLRLKLWQRTRCSWRDEPAADAPTRGRTSAPAAAASRAWVSTRKPWSHIPRTA